MSEHNKRCRDDFWIDWLLNGVLLFLCIAAHARITKLETRIAALEAAAEVEQSE